MLSASRIEAAARRLHEAERTRHPVRALSLDHPDMDIDDAYAIQKAWIAIKCAAGQCVRGHKIGLTSRAMQQAVHIDEPDSGVLLDPMFFANDSVIPASRFIVPMVEVELAFVLRSRLEGPEVTLSEVLGATDYVVPALEIIDARCHRVDPETRRPRLVFDTIADNAANAGIVIGDRRVDPGQIDLRWVAALLYRNGVIEETGVAAGVLEHPANAIAWLVRKLSAYAMALEPGQVVMAGSFTRPVAARPEDTFYVDYGTLGVISVRFEA